MNNREASETFSYPLKILILIVILAYFGVGCYWLRVTSIWSTHMVVALEEYAKLVKEIWWLATFYSSELGLSVGIVLRWIAGVFALYSAVAFLRRGEDALPKIKGKVAAALLFEGAYFLTYFPSVVLGYLYYIAYTQGLWYFEPRPPWLIPFLVCGIACLPMVFVLAPLLFKLRSKVLHASKLEIARWSCITGAAYLFLAFWLNYSLAWVATLVYWPERAQPGIEILMDSINLASFLLTVVGLLAIAASYLKVTLPLIRGKVEELNLKHLGYVMLAFGLYFILMFVFYFVKGGYHAEPTVWMELSGPLHNPDFWCASFIFPGLYLSFRTKK